MPNTRSHIADLIYRSLVAKEDELRLQFAETKSAIGYCYIDELLPEELVQQIHEYFPKPEAAKLKKNIKEYKYIAYQMDLYHPLLEEVIYAFQDPKVVKKIGEICEMPQIEADEHLYAGGLSLMKKDQYLSPHLDNSHDKDRNLWRVLNLLYYVTPDWELQHGGNLELWPNGVQEAPVTITSKQNRLVIMATHQASWHSVSPVINDAIRCCVSNYYFSEIPVKPTDTFHVTTFRGRPGEGFKDLILKADSALRMFVRKVFKKGVRENPHQYKKAKPTSNK